MSANGGSPYQSVDERGTTEGETANHGRVVGVERGPLGDPTDDGREVLVTIDAPEPIGRRSERIVIDEDGSVGYGPEGSS